MFTIFLSEDDPGAFPLLLRDGEAFLPPDAERWRVATTDHPREAAGVVEVLNRYCFSEPQSVV